MMLANMLHILHVLNRIFHMIYYAHIKNNIYIKNIIYCRMYKLFFIFKIRIFKNKNLQIFTYKYIIIL